MKNKDVKKVIRRKEKDGWRTEIRKKHIYLYPPDKSVDPILISTTPGDQGAIHKIQADIRRAERECAANKKAGK